MAADPGAMKELGDVLMQWVKNMASVVETRYSVVDVAT